MRLLVLAGGFGARLKVAVGDVPKALAPVFHRPFLQLQLEHWRTQGIRTFSFLLHHKAEEIIAFLKSQKLDLLKNCHVDWVIESTPLDTGGAIANSVMKLNIKGDFIVANADTWLGGGVAELVLGTSPSIIVVNLNNISRYGQVQIDRDFYVTQFAEKSAASISGWINAGMFRLDASLFQNWDGRPFSLERELFVKLVQTHKLRAIPLKTDFIDIGVPEDYSKFCSWIKSDREKPL